MTQLEVVKKLLSSHGEDMAVLYTGTNPSHFVSDKLVIHCPLIEIVPRPFDDVATQAMMADLDRYTHIVFTSKNTVPIFCTWAEKLGLPINAQIIAVGSITADALHAAGLKPALIASDEQQEGVIELLMLQNLERAYILVPRSSRARPHIQMFLETHRIRHQLCNLYDTVTKVPHPLPNLSVVDEIVFTSPSTVDAFIQIFDILPVDKQLTPIGPVTEEKLRGVLHGQKI